MTFYKKETEQICVCGQTYEGLPVDATPTPSGATRSQGECISVLAEPLVLDNERHSVWEVALEIQHTTDSYQYNKDLHFTNCQPLIEFEYRHLIF